MEADHPGPHEQACIHCQHLLCMVALGLGLRCNHPANRRDDELFQIPSRHFVCEHFQRKDSALREGAGEDLPSGNPVRPGD